MKTQQKQKKEKNQSKVGDLKPEKDPKAGVPPPCGPGHPGNPTRMPTAVE